LICARVRKKKAGTKPKCETGNSGWSVYVEATSSRSSTQTALNDDLYWNWRHLGSEEDYSEQVIGYRVSGPEACRHATAIPITTVLIIPV